MTEEKFARLITAMQDELVAHQEILAFLAFEVSAARGVDIRDLSGRLHAMADGDTRSNIGECVRHFARFIVVGQPPQLSIIDGGKEQAACLTSSLQRVLNGGTGGEHRSRNKHEATSYEGNQSAGGALNCDSRCRHQRADDQQSYPGKSHMDLLTIR